MMVERSSTAELVAAVGSVRDGRAPRVIRNLFATAEAWDIVRSSIRDAPSLSSAVHELGGHLWAESGNELLAIDVLREAVRLGASEAFVALGEALGWMGAFEEAVTVMTEAQSHGIGDPARVAGVLGESRFALGDESEAVESLLGEGAREYPEFGLDHARILRIRGEAERACAVLRRLVDSNVFGAALVLGNILDDDLHRKQEAVSAYLAGIESGDSHSAFNLAVLFYKDGDLIEAERFFTVAREMGDLSEGPDFQSNDDE